jgi:hypothetical protein
VGAPRPQLRPGRCPHRHFGGARRADGHRGWGWQQLAIFWQQPANVNVICGLGDLGSAPFPAFSMDYFSLQTATLDASGFANLYCKVAPAVTSSAATSTLLPRHDDIVALGAAGYAAQELATRLMNQINIGGPAVWEHYLTLSQQLLSDFGQELDLLAGHHQFFARRMYVPEYPPHGLSQTEVYPIGEPDPSN